MVHDGTFFETPGFGLAGESDVLQWLSLTSPIRFAMLKRHLDTHIAVKVKYM